MQTTSGGSFLVADTYCKARGGSLLHSLNELTQNFISQELERAKSKLKSKLVWLGAKREVASTNSQSATISGSTSALVQHDVSAQGAHLFFDKSLSASLFDAPIENLFAADQDLMSVAESSPIFSPHKLSRASSLMQASSGAGGSTSRGSQTFGLSSVQTHQQANKTIAHSGRSLIVSQPSHVAALFNSPVQSQLASNNNPTQPVNSNIAPQTTSSFVHPPSTHVHRTLRPPALTPIQSHNTAAQTVNSPSWNTQAVIPNAAPITTFANNIQPSATNSAWRWVGDAASDTLSSPIQTFLWADDQPNNYNNQQDCLVLDGAKKWLWNDVTCELDYLPWVCQYRPSTCGSPDRHENSTILELHSSQDTSGSSHDSLFAYGKTVTYACPLGHRLDGSQTRKCQYDGSWTGKAPRCVYVDCGPVGSQSIENGRVIYLNQSQTTFGSQVKYICNEDYVLVGEDTRHCQIDAKWGAKQPYCAYKWCPVLQTIQNGYLNVTGQGEGSVATYQCNSGHKLIGNDTRQCMLGGKWTNQEPFCQYVDCGQPKQISNGAFRLVNGTTTYLSVALYTCNENYTLVGVHDKLVCSHSNRWSGKEPQCQLITCGQPQSNAGSHFEGDSYTIHSSVDYVCEPGFKEVSGTVQRTCGANGQWTGQPLSCKYVDCGRVPAILKGDVSYINGTTYLASQVSYECTPGNRLSGHRVRFCGPDGKWTGSSPKCEEVRCSAPELPVNGSALYIGNDRSFKEQSFSVGVTVQYQCDYGHVVKGSWSSRLCQANGEWSGEPPVCKFVDCGAPPTIENGNYALKHPPSASTATNSVASLTGDILRRQDASQSATTFTYFGTIAHYSCDVNYKLQGPAQRECLESGDWRTPLASCEPVQCPKPEHFDEYTLVSLVARASQSWLDSSTHSSTDQLTASAVAKSGVRLIANGQWTQQYASSAGGGNNLTFGVGDKLHYSCTPGYELYGGPETRTCTQYGQWSGSSTPRCRLIDCGRPAPIGAEGRFYLVNETTSFNSLVEYSCVRPFKLIEAKVSMAGNLIETLTSAQSGVIPLLTSLPIGVKVCANNGQWMPNDQQPRCVSSDTQIDTATSSQGKFDAADNSLDDKRQDAKYVHDLDAQSGRQLNLAQNSGTSLWAKIVIAVCLFVMLLLIVLTLVCIKFGKRPKQKGPARGATAGNYHHHHHQQHHASAAAVAAAAAMQMQIATGKVAYAQQTNTGSLAVPGQNIYINGMHKIIPAALVGQTQMLSAHYGNDQPAAKLVLSGDNSIIAVGAAGTGVGLVSEDMSGNSSSLGVINARMRSSGEHQIVSCTSSLVDSYSRLSIDSDATNVVGQHTGANKTIRHNPNGLVTFVSPAQQHQQQQQQQNCRTLSGNPTSQHQVSPQMISTSLSVSSSSSPSSSSSAHNTTATRLSGSDSTASPSSNSTSHQHSATVTGDIQLQHQNGYQSPHHLSKNVSLTQPSPPSLPAHPPPSHRVQKHPKQMQNKQPARQNTRASRTATGGVSNDTNFSDHHYTEPTL